MAAVDQEMLALPSGQAPDRPPRNQLTLGVLVACAGGTMLFAALIAAYLAVKSETAAWPPRGVRFDNYTAATLVITLMLASVTIEWAVSAVRHDQRAQAIAALGLTLGFGLAFVNAAWFLTGALNFEVAAHPYGTIVYTMAFLTVLNALLGLGFVLLTALRVVAHQISAADLAVMRSTALYWHFVTVASTAVLYTLYVSK